MPRTEPVARRVRRLKIDEWLRSQHAVIWPGVVFYTDQEEQRAEAVAFIERLIDAVG